MKIEELRVGNLFSNIIGISTIIAVTEIREDAIIGKTIDLKFNGSFDIENIKPIPLTEEWLLKFGFTTYDSYGWTEGKKVLSKSKICFIVAENIFFIECEDPYHYFSLPEIKSVHQLQNLYFALTGNELTIQK